MLPTHLPTQGIIFLLPAWLVACVVYDLRTRQVPAWLTILPLILAILWRLFHDGWQVALLVIALILISDLPWGRWRIPLGCLACGLVLLVRGPISSILAIFAVWALWERGATGGADAKMIITLVLVFADGWVLIPIALAGGVQGLVGLLSRQKTIPYTLAISLGTAVWLWVWAGQ